MGLFLPRPELRKVIGKENSARSQRSVLMVGIIVLGNDVNCVILICKPLIRVSKYLRLNCHELLNRIVISFCFRFLQISIVISLYCCAEPGCCFFLVIHI